MSKNWIIFTNIIWSAHCRICQLPSISFPRLSLSFGIWGRNHLIIGLRGRGFGRTDKIWGWSLRQVSVELCPMGLFESCTQPKVGQFDMASCVQEKIVRLNVPEIKNKQWYKLFKINPSNICSLKFLSERSFQTQIGSKEISAALLFLKYLFSNYIIWSMVNIKLHLLQ